MWKFSCRCDDHRREKETFCFFFQFMVVFLDQRNCRWLIKTVLSYGVESCRNFFHLSNWLEKTRRYKDNCGNSRANTCWAIKKKQFFLVAHALAALLTVGGFLSWKGRKFRWTMLTRDRIGAGCVFFLWGFVSRKRDESRIAKFSLSNEEERTKKNARRPASCGSDPSALLWV